MLESNQTTSVMQAIIAQTKCIAPFDPSVTVVTDDSRVFDLGLVWSQQVEIRGLFHLDKVVSLVNIVDSGKAGGASVPL
jgi:hypothetical protein